MLALALLVARGAAPTWPLLAGAAFLVAHFLAYDPYYFLTLRRASDGGILSPWLVAAVVAAALAAAALRRRLVAAPLLVALGLLGWVADAGH